MKNLASPLCLVILLVTASLSFTLVDNNSSLEIGTAAPLTGLEMEDAISGNSYTLDDIKAENGLLVMFSSNTCPWVHAWEDRYDDIAAACTANKIGLIVVNSNEKNRSGVDSKAENAGTCKDAKIQLPICGRY